MKELTFLVEAGHGHWLPNLVHPQFGNGIWGYNAKSCKIQIFDVGLIFQDTKNSAQNDIAFADIQDIKSFLTASVISEASRRDNLEMSLPMKIIARGKQFDLDVPLVVYSAVLISIQEHRKKSSGSK